MNRFFTLLLAASCLTTVGQVPDYVPTDGLVAWWGFSGNASDLSGNGNHLTIHNQVHFMDVNANRDGIYLDGSPSYLSCIPFVGIGTGASHTLAFWTAGEMSPGGRYALAEFNGNPQLAQAYIMESELNGHAMGVSGPHGLLQRRSQFRLLSGHRLDSLDDGVRSKRPESQDLSKWDSHH